MSHAMDRVVTDDPVVARMLRELEGRTGYERIWECEDGWRVIYSTERISEGPYAGKFLCLAYKPVGPGSRSGRDNAGKWKRVYIRDFRTRKSARARALDLYYTHSPKHEPIDLTDRESIERWLDA